MTAVPSRRAIDVEAWRWVERHAPGGFRAVMGYGAIAAAQSLLLLPLLLLLRHAVDVAIPRGQVGLLAAIGAGIFGLRALNSGITLWLRRRSSRAIERTVERVRADLLDHVYALSRASATQLELETTHARLVIDTDRLDHAAQAVVLRLVPGAFSVLALLTLLAVLEWRLLLAGLVVAPLLFVTIRLTGRRVKRRVYEMQRAFERFSNGVLFALQHLDLTHAHGAERQEIARRAAELADLRERSVRLTLEHSAHNQIQSLVVTLCGAGILVAGGAAVASGRMTMGAFLSFWVAAGLLNGQLSTILAAIPEWIGGNESVMTLHAFARSGEPAPYRGVELLEPRGVIELDGVTFGYRDAPVLRDVRLVIAPGEVCAISGPNGAGKSTLLHLILGFYRPQRGEVRADGVPYDRLDLPALRRRIGAVMQHPSFFAGSLYANIAYGAPDATLEDVRRAARLALAEDFVSALPAGYDTAIGEGGVLLSGGEAQRIAIARALIRRPRLLLLDEPTNHLERALIDRLLANLATLEERPAVLVISHDRDLLRHAAAHYRLAEGTLVRCEPIAVVRETAAVPGSAA